MDHKVWQKLLVLESRDAVSRLYKKVHGRDLSAKRAIPINNAAKQAREYFRNAAASNYSVRPLLTFYGVASLSRALILFLKRNGGEENFSASHGLTAKAWKEHFKGELHQGIEALLNLKLELSSGLFQDLIDGTDNLTCIHTHSTKVDWFIKYNKPELKFTFSLKDVLSRLPDLKEELETAGHYSMSSYCSNLNFNVKSGFGVTLNRDIPLDYQSFLKSNGYEFNSAYAVKATSEVFSEYPLLFTHTSLNKAFHSIPSLAISPPIDGKGYFSEISLLYASSFCLSMLVRYFPTHWVSLVQGGKGDILWPVIYKAQQLVECAFPELVIEMIEWRVEQGPNSH